jgi:transposase-like protein
MRTLTMKDEKRLESIERVFRDERIVIEAARTVGVSRRQCYWIKARVKKRGVKGILP